MPIVEWSEILSLGMEPFDTHHKHLVGLLNRTYDDFTSGASKERISAVLDELIDYACYHFAAEELWMKENKYPRLKKHLEEHEVFSQKVVVLQKDFYADKAGVSLGVLNFLKEWLIEHIMASDADYSSFARKEGSLV